MGAEVLAWPQPSVPPLHLQLSSADDLSIEEADLHPNFIFLEVYRLWCISPKSLACVLGFFS